MYNPCYGPSACINTKPGYQCLACLTETSGYYTDALSTDTHVRKYLCNGASFSVIQDVDECLVDNGGCDVNVVCINTVVSMHLRLL